MDADHVMGGGGGAANNDPSNYKRAKQIFTQI